MHKPPRSSRQLRVSSRTFSLRCVLAVPVALLDPTPASPPLSTSPRTVPYPSPCKKTTTKTDNIHPQRPYLSQYLFPIQFALVNSLNHGAIIPVYSHPTTNPHRQREDEQNDNHDDDQHDHGHDVPVQQISSPGYFAFEILQSVGVAPKQTVPHVPVKRGLSLLPATSQAPHLPPQVQPSSRLEQR
jgi:hypothetical protein